MFRTAAAVLALAAIAAAGCTDTASPDPTAAPSPDRGATTSWTSDQFGVTVDVPEDWTEVAGEDARLEGPDGFVQFVAADTESGQLADLCDAEAQHKMQPYGSAPRVDEIVLSSGAACRIQPSDDQSPLPVRYGAVVAAYPEPIAVRDTTYPFLVMTGDVDHLDALTASLRFVPVVPPTDDEPTPTAVAIDWTARPALVTFPGGWELTPCEGDAPLLCLARDGERVGYLELSTYPASVEEFPTAELTPDALVARAADAISSHRADRAQGCPDGYAFTAPEPAVVDFGGADGARFEFTVADADGEIVEHVVGFLTVRDHAMAILVAQATTSEACTYDPELTPFLPDALADFAPHLGAVAAGSVLPEPVTAQ